MGLSIAELDLVPEVAAKVLQIQKAHPQVVFLSGRRTLQQQCQAMTHNLITSGNRRWLTETYAASPIIARLQLWVNTHFWHDSEKTTAAFIGVFRSFPSTTWEHVSRHLTGKAVDFEPDSCPLAAIEITHPRKILEDEGGLRRLHAEWE